MNPWVSLLAKWVVKALSLMLAIFGVALGVVFILAALSTKDSIAIVLSIIPLLFAGLFVAVALLVIFRYSGEAVARLIGVLIFIALSHWMQSRFPMGDLRDDGPDMREWALLVLYGLFPAVCGWFGYRVMRRLLRETKVETPK